MTTAKNMSTGECYTQSVKVDEQVTLLGGIQVHLQPAPLLSFTTVHGYEMANPYSINGVFQSHGYFIPVVVGS